MTEAETAWVAGILDGEGCFDYNRTPKYPRIRVEMTDHDVIDRLHKLLGGRTSYPKKRQPHHQQVKLLVVNGDAAAQVMRAVLPWMSIRRSEKITTLVNGI